MSPPLIVDLDGTLLRSDLLLETGLRFVRMAPHLWFKPLLWLRGGKAALKQRLAEATDLDIGALPYDAVVINFIVAERAKGRRVVLATASHRILAEAGLFMVPALLLSAFALALWQLPAAFAGVLLCYYLLTLSYSLVLKRLMVVDVMTLAALYTLRVFAGATALTIPLSFWLLAFSMFMFLSLAFVKRHAELFAEQKRGQHGKTRGRGYYPSDLDMITSLGASAGYMAVMVLALYIHEASTTNLYRHDELIWLACPLLLGWISRVWMLAQRGQMPDDPVVFALRDRVSLAIGACMALVFWMAA